MEEIDEKIRVRFTTKYDEFRVSDAPIAIPSKLRRHELTEIINHLLEKNDSNQQYDFLISNRLLRQPLRKLIQALKLSTENILTVEYIPSVSFEGKSDGVETPAWIGAIDVTTETPSEALIFTGSYDGTLRVVDPNNFEVITSYQPHFNPIRCLCQFDLSTIESSSAATSKFVATGSKDQSIQIHEISHLKSEQLILPICKLDGHINSVESLAFMNSQQLLFSGDWSGNIFSWHLDNGVYQSIVSTARENKATGSSNADISRNKKSRKKSKHDENSDALNNRPEPRFQLIESEMKPLFTLHAHAQTISSIRCLTQSSHLITSSWDHTVKYHDIETQNCIHTFSTSRVITGIDCKEEFHLLTTAHTDGKLRLWDMRQREVVGCMETYGRGSGEDSNAAWVSEVRWQPLESSYLFASTSYDGCVKLWDTRSHIPLSTSSCHDGKALCLTWIRVDNIEDVVNQVSSRTDFNPPLWRVLSGGSDCCLRSTPLQGYSDMM